MKHGIFTYTHPSFSNKIINAADKYHGREHARSIRTGAVMVRDSKFSHACCVLTLSRGGPPRRLVGAREDGTKNESRASRKRSACGSRRTHTLPLKVKLRWSERLTHALPRITHTLPLKGKLRWSTERITHTLQRITHTLPLKENCDIFPMYVCRTPRR